jgi:uncharacterized protein YecT (DUF1311 family)
MLMTRISCLLILLASPFAALADPSFECSVNLSSQVEIAECVVETEAAVNQTVDIALGFAMGSAKEHDDVTGRQVAAPALEASQAAWSVYRDAHCEYVGSTFGGGSGSGIAIRSCRVELGRARVSELMSHVQ